MPDTESFTCPCCHVTLHLQPERHVVRYCPCGAMGIDLEDYGCRYLGAIPKEVKEKKSPKIQSSKNTESKRTVDPKRFVSR